MDYEKTINYIENSFLKELITKEDVTDVSYNGDSIFYQHNIYGRKKSDINPSKTEIRDFIRQISFLTEKQFSFQNPHLDVSVGRYRINATHSSIGRIGYEETVTFCFRMASYEPKITRDNGFLPDKVIALFDVLLNSKVSMAIGGVTGSGKTELQKYLLRSLKDNTRAIVIDNVLELEQVRENSTADITTWLYDDHLANTSINSLVRNALRNNPDWLIVAESRGKEMVELLNSMMTGHPIITTVHAFDVKTMPSRIIRMIMMDEGLTRYEDVKSDLLYHLRFFIYMEHTTDKSGKSHRYIKAIDYVEENGQRTSIYSYEKNKHIYKKLPKTAINFLKFDKNDGLFIKTFVEDTDHE